MSGKVNISERLINVVMVDKPKVLKGLNQKVRSKDVGIRIPASWPRCCRRTRRTYPTRAQKWNTVSPSCSLWESKPQGVPIARRVKEEGESEGQSVIGWIGIAPTQHHPTRKRADFPLVFHHEKIG